MFSQYLTFSMGLGLCARRENSNRYLQHSIRLGTASPCSSLRCRFCTNNVGIRNTGWRPFGCRFAKCRRKFYDHTRIAIISRTRKVFTPRICSTYIDLSICFPSGCALQSLTLFLLLRSAEVVDINSRFHTCCRSRLPTEAASNALWLHTSVIVGPLNLRNQGDHLTDYFRSRKECERNRKTVNYTALSKPKL